ncbi:VOC family protein [[Mycobacterium] wendilense]|uniref:VOC family protein n=1 Tax=[Mycobacterium] wendilense TaxID=3064284 RepID=A0ABN9NYM5_9MYCO|nr:VOC family protein [Mycolicibacterium sp. MU0050]CAJ1579870.1 VOC family protein [Mycolicibacterium sp. MU0050]
MQPSLPSSKVDQLGFLVPDLKIGVQHWTAALNVTDWRVYTYSPDMAGTRFSYRGQAGEFTMRLALANTVPQIELIQPIAGPSLYHDWIAQRGYGFHHVGFFVPSITDTVDEYRASGLEPAQTGSGYGVDGDGGFAYYEMEDQLGTVVEFIEVPANRRPSETL